MSFYWMPKTAASITDSGTGAMSTRQPELGGRGGSGKEIEIVRI